MINKLTMLVKSGAQSDTFNKSYWLTVLFLGDMTAATVFSPVVANETSTACKVGQIKYINFRMYFVKSQTKVIPLFDSKHSIEKQNLVVTSPAKYTW